MIIGFTVAFHFGAAIVEYDQVQRRSLILGQVLPAD